MLKRLLGKLLAADKAEPHPKFDPLLDAVAEHIKKSSRYIYYRERVSMKECKAYQTLKNLPPSEKVELVEHLALGVNILQRSAGNTYGPSAAPYNTARNILDAIMRTRIDFPQTYVFTDLFDLFYANGQGLMSSMGLDERPFGLLIMQIEKHTKRYPMSAALKADIQHILDDSRVKQNLTGNSSAPTYGSDLGKAARKLQRLLLSEADEEGQKVSPYMLGSGRFGSLVDADRAQMNQEQQNRWNTLFHHLGTASTGKPSNKFLKNADALIDVIGASAFKEKVNQWLGATATLDVLETTQEHTYGGRTYRHQTHLFIEAHNYPLLKGLLWSMSRFHDRQSLRTIALLVEKTFQKIPGVGPAAPAVGNAGIYTLAQSKGLEGISHLSRLKLRIRQNSTQKLIQKYIDEQAGKRGLKPAQIEEVAAQDFGLKDGERIEAFNEYRLVLRLTGVGSTELQWLKPDGTPQKSVPAFVKSSKKLADKLKRIREQAKQIKQASVAQRDRIDRLYTEDMRWTLADVEKHYVDHGLIGPIARKLLWILDETVCLYGDGQWRDIDGNAVTPSDKAQIRLWHPIDSEPETVLAWRNRLEELRIQQPFKQVYRELYLLTEAEISTRVYSNRMAAHLLKQHQFNALASLRGWKYALLGAYDDGRDGEIARKPLPAHGLEAQFWINEIYDDNDSFNDTGIWDYVATDQVRFLNADEQPVNLIEVPALILSEVMRDADLFVGVASVGNDPQWQDGGPEGRQDYRDYWQSYSFGDLTEVAKTRKAVLERLVPRLKIRDVARIDGKFLIVSGKRHDYKIHIGSGNILIAPNDRYLCIVPSRGKDKALNQVFLPFEGDAGLSIVLSKAFLLADDDKITDSTILSQI